MFPSSKPCAVDPFIKHARERNRKVEEENLFFLAERAHSPSGLTIDIITENPSDGLTGLTHTVRILHSKELEVKLHTEAG